MQLRREAPHSSHEQSQHDVTEWHCERTEVDQRFTCQAIDAQRLESAQRVRTRPVLKVGAHLDLARDPIRPDDVRHEKSCCAKICSSPRKLGIGCRHTAVQKMGLYVTTGKITQQRRLDWSPRLCLEIR